MLAVVKVSGSSKSCKLICVEHSFSQIWSQIVMKDRYAVLKGSPPNNSINFMLINLPCCIILLHHYNMHACTLNDKSFEGEKFDSLLGSSGMRGKVL